MWVFVGLVYNVLVVQMNNAVVAAIITVVCIIGTILVATQNMFLLGLWIGALPWSVPLAYGCIMNWYTNR